MSLSGKSVLAILETLFPYLNFDRVSSSDEMLIMALFDMWLAGQETTVATLGWAFSYLLLNPEVKLLLTFYSCFCFGCFGFSLRLNTE